MKFALVDAYTGRVERLECADSAFEATEAHVTREDIYLPASYYAYEVSDDFECDMGEEAREVLAGYKHESIEIMPPKYRWDSAYRKLYEYSRSHDAYLFAASGILDESREEVIARYERCECEHYFGY